MGRYAQVLKDWTVAKLLVKHDARQWMVGALETFAFFTIAHANPVLIQPGETAGLMCPTTAYRSLRRPVEAIGVRANLSASTPNMRVAIWGDSHTAAHAFTESMIAAMTLDPEEVQPSFLAANWSVKGVTHPLQQVCATTSWRHHLPLNRDIDVGAGLSAMSTDQPGSLLAFDFRWPITSARLSSVRLHIGKLDAGRTLVLAISADAGPEVMVTLPGEVDKPFQLDFSRPVATLQVRLVAGHVTVHGLSPVYAAQRPFRLDVFSTPGATMSFWERVDVRSKAFVASRPEIDLAILQYGTNDAPDASGRIGDYLAALRIRMQQFRVAYPGVKCVLMGPPDRGGQARDISYSQLHTQISRAQQLVAPQFGCSFWDWQAQMGGAGSAAAGVKRAVPYMQPDMVHLTPDGYRDSGRSFGVWLMQRRH